jgi:uncharacterized protein (DUF1015 family)
MAEIKPFKLVRYNGRCAQELDRLITPPYDVISPQEQDAFYESHPLNMIRLVLGKQLEGDNDRDNRYVRAGTTLKQWLQDGVLSRRERPGFLIYQMEFEWPEGTKTTVDGIVSLVEVDDYGKGRVLPHEKTYKGPKKDQLNLMRACRANLTPIHALFGDDGGAVFKAYKPFMEGPPDQEAVDADGTIHRTWMIEDEDCVAEIVGLLADESIFIADGHHRYETAMAYKKEVLEKGGNGPMESAGYVMMFLTPMSHPGLIIRPAHRMIVGLDEIDVDGLWKRLQSCFDMDRLYFSEADQNKVTDTLLKRIAGHVDIGGKFGMYIHGENCFRLLRLKEFDCVDSYIDPAIPNAVRNLDVTVLREVVISRGLRIDKENVEGHIVYTPSARDALDKARRGEVQISFIMNPTRMDQVRNAAELGHKLPHKSTYFYPKLSSGLVMNVF